MYGTDKKVLLRRGFEPMIFINIYSNADIKKNYRFLKVEFTR